MATDGYHSMIFVDDLNDLPSVNATPENENGTEGASYRHTYDSWHLVPSNRPDIAIPPLRERLLEVPGSDGSLDLTSALTGYPLYGMREGSQEFWVLNDHPELWVTLRDTIITYLHGKTKYMVLEDDPNYYYEGRWKVNEWKSDKDRSIITLDYTLKPYKLKPKPTMYWIDLSNNIERSVTIAQSDYPVIPNIRLTQIGLGTVTKIAYTNKRGEVLDFDSEEHPAVTLKSGNNYLTDMNTYFLNQNVRFLTIVPGVEDPDYVNIFNIKSVEILENTEVASVPSINDYILKPSNIRTTYKIPINPNTNYYFTIDNREMPSNVFLPSYIIVDDLNNTVAKGYAGNPTHVFSNVINSTPSGAYLYISSPIVGDAIQSAMVIQDNIGIRPSDDLEYITPTGPIANITMYIQEGRL